MSKNEVMTESSTGALKAGNDERYDLIPAEALREIAEHFGKGARKYGPDNWRKGMEWSKNFAALNRHLWQFWNGEDIDTETGSKHIIAVAWHALVLATFMDEHPEFDDRFVPTLPPREPRMILADPTDDLVMTASRWLPGEPRRTQTLDETCRTSEWVRQSTGERYRWNENRFTHSGVWDVFECGGWHFAGYAPTAFGPDMFIEVL